MTTSWFITHGNGHSFPQNVSLRIATPVCVCVCVRKLKKKDDVFEYRTTTKLNISEIRLWILRILLGISCCEQTSMVWPYHEERGRVSAEGCDEVKDDEKYTKRKTKTKVATLHRELPERK